MIRYLRVTTILRRTHIVACDDALGYSDEDAANLVVVDLRDGAKVEGYHRISAVGPPPLCDYHTTEAGLEPGQPCTQPFAEAIYTIDGHRWATDGCGAWREDAPWPDRSDWKAVVDFATFLSNLGAGAPVELGPERNRGHRAVRLIGHQDVSSELVGHHREGDLIWARATGEPLTWHRDGELIAAVMPLRGER